MSIDRSRLIPAIAAVSLSLGLAGCSHDTLHTSSGTMTVSATAAHALGQSVASLTVFGAKPRASDTTQPIGAHEFCRIAGNCPTVNQLRVRHAAAQGAKITLADLHDVSATVNQTYLPASDFAMYKKDEVWTYPQGNHADCEDYALVKRRMLLEMGVPPENLAIVVVRRIHHKDEGHAILTAELEGDVYVLDNLEDLALPLSETLGEYKYVKWSNDLERWYNFEPGLSVTATAAATSMPAPARP